MRKLMLVWAVLLVAVLPSATQARAVASAAAPMAKPKLSCAIQSAQLLGKNVVAQGGCKIGAKSAPAVWSWTAHAADLSGSPCSFGSGTGHGKTYYPPKAPSLGQPGVASTLPGLLKMDYTVSAKWGKQKVSVHKTVSLRNPQSRVICGRPPAISATAATEASGCVWATKPVFDGVSLRVGQVACPGDGPCSWQTPRALMQSHYLVYRSEFSCQNDTNGYISISVKYSEGNVVKCQTGITGISGFSIMPQWGYGYVLLLAVVNSWPATGNQYPYNDQNSWNTGWVLAKGKTDPCGGYIY